MGLLNAQVPVDFISSYDVWKVTNAITTGILHMSSRKMLVRMLCQKSKLVTHIPNVTDEKHSTASHVNRASCSVIINRRHHIPKFHFNLFMRDPKR